MATQLSPGVQVVEKDYTQIVPTVSTSTGAFAGVFKWGPVEQPTLVSTESDMLAVYGRPNDSNYQSFFTVKNFLEYSKQMYVTRVDSGSGRNAVALQSGPVTSVVLTTPGTGYRAVPNVVFAEAPAVGDGTPATATAVLTGGAIASYAVVSGGSGYAVGDIIVLSQPEETVDTYDVETGELVSSEYIVAKASVATIDGNGSIVTITFVGTGLEDGMGYIDPTNISYDVLNSTQSAPSAGVGANITFAVATSGIKRVDVVTGGSGYTTAQLPINVTFVVDPDLQSNYTGTPATAFAQITAAGNKIKNFTHYLSSWADGQGAYGEFAAKYPGDMGNSLTVSMCDNANWSTPVNGIFSARETVEDKEDERELAYVRRILDNEEAFSNDALDAGKVLRTTSGKLIGEIDSIIDTVEYRKITLTADSKYAFAVGQHVRHSNYGSVKNISRVARTTAGIVTITTTAAHGLVEGQYVTVAANIQKSVNVTNAKILSVTSTTFTYQTERYIAISSRVDSGTIKSESQGVIDGFVKVWNDKTDEYELSKKELYVTVANDSAGNDFAVGRILVDVRGERIGAIKSVEQVQTIILKTVSYEDVYNDSVVAEWKYKSLFNNNAPSTSPYALRNGGSYDELHVVVIDNDGRLTGTAGNVLERWSDLSKAADARNVTTGKSIYYKDVLNSGSKWIWVLDHTSDVESSTVKANWGSNASAGRFKDMTTAVIRTLSGGVDTTEASAGNYISAYQLYDDPASYDISLIPLGHLPASTAKSIITGVAEKRKDCVAFVSPPLYIGTANSIAQSIVTYRNQIGSSSYAVMDSGWKYQYDKYSDKFRWMPMAGDVAGLCAYTDSIADPWFSPGGFNRGQIKNVTKLAFNPTAAQRDILYANGVNPIVTFPAEGTILYGDKTLQTKASAFDRINVRRLFIVLEKAVSTASKYQLFEFNDDFTRAQFRSLVEPYLRDVQGRRGILDFKVKCDTTNNTAEVIDRNEFIADIYIKPNRSINFITLNFIATKTGVSFEEIGG